MQPIHSKVSEPPDISSLPDSYGPTSTMMWASGPGHASSKHTSTPLSTFAPPSAQFGAIHLDLVGPLPHSNGYTYLLTGEAFPLLDITAETVARTFLSGLWNDLMVALGTQCLRTSAYHQEYIIEGRVSNSALSHTSTVYRPAHGVDDVGQAITPPICVVGVSSHFNFSTHFNLSVHSCHPVRFLLCHNTS